MSPRHKVAEMQTRAWSAVLALLVLVCAIAACSTDTDSASTPIRSPVLPANTSQYERMYDAMEKAKTAAPNTPLIESVAREKIDCTSNHDALCARLFIMRASACSQLTNIGNAENRASSRACAVTDYQTALERIPPSNAEDDRTKALIGLANALKTTRDYTANSSDASAVQTQLDGTLSRLDAQPGGKPFAQYFRADQQAIEASDAHLSSVQACPKLQLAQAALPASPTDAALAQRVAQLRNSINTLAAAKGCR